MRYHQPPTDPFFNVFVWLLVAVALFSGAALLYTKAQARHENLELCALHRQGFVALDKKALQACTVEGSASAASAN
jgi:hypothetical protein